MVMNNSSLTSYFPSSEITANLSETTTDSLMVLKLTCMTLISLVGITGNLLICGALVNKCKSSEYFILNLAIADLMVCAVGIPLDIYDELHPTWMYGAVLCKIIFPFQTLLILVSILTLTAMSLERYRVIITPMKMKFTRAAIVKTIILIWILGIAVVTPYVNALTYTGGYCDEQWSGERDSEYYTLALFIIDYCIPLSIISYCYARIGFKLYKSSEQFEPATKHVSQLQRDARRARFKRNTRIIKVFCFAVIMFMICMLPGDIFWMWMSWGKGATYHRHFQTFANILVYANSAINPFIFGSFNFACTRTFCSQASEKSSTYSLRFSFTSSHRRRSRLDAMYQWRRAGKRVRSDKHDTTVIWETNL